MESLVFDKQKEPISKEAIGKYFVGVITTWLTEKRPGDYENNFKRKALLISPFTELKDDRDIRNGDQVIDKDNLLLFLTGKVSLFELRTTLPRFVGNLGTDTVVLIEVKSNSIYSKLNNNLFSLREVIGKITDIGEDGFVMTPRVIDGDEIINQSNLWWARAFLKRNTSSPYMLTMLKIRDYSSEPDIEVVKGLVQKRFSEWISGVFPNRKWREIQPNRRTEFSKRERQSIGLYFEFTMPGYVYMTPFIVEDVVNPKSKKVTSVLKRQTYSIQGKYMGLANEIKFDKPTQVMFIPKSEFRKIFKAETRFNRSVSFEIGEILLFSLAKALVDLDETYFKAVMRS